MEPSPGHTAPAAPVETPEREPYWTCPVCDTRNRIELNACSACGTPFARLFLEPERPVEIGRGRALVWSLVFPGLGHWMAGKRVDGVARLVLFLWTFGTVVVLLASRAGKGGLGPTVSLFYLFLLASLVLYAVSALDAHRIAGGDPPLVSSRILLWASAGLVVVSVVVASLVALPAARGR